MGQAFKALASVTFLIAVTKILDVNKIRKDLVQVTQLTGQKHSPPWQRRHC